MLRKISTKSRKILVLAYLQKMLSINVMPRLSCISSYFSSPAWMSVVAAKHHSTFTVLYVCTTRLLRAFVTTYDDDDDGDAAVDIQRYETSRSATTISSTWLQRTNCCCGRCHCTACRPIRPTGCSAKSSARCPTCSASPTSTPAYWRSSRSASIDAWPAITTRPLYDEFRSVSACALAFGLSLYSSLCRTPSTPPSRSSAVDVDVGLSGRWRSRPVVPGPTPSWRSGSPCHSPSSPAPTPFCSGDCVVGQSSVLAASLKAVAEAVPPVDCRHLVQWPWPSWSSSWSACSSDASFRTTSSRLCHWWRTNDTWQTARGQTQPTEQHSSTSTPPLSCSSMFPAAATPSSTASSTITIVSHCRAMRARCTTIVGLSLHLICVGWYR